MTNEEILILKRYPICDTDIWVDVNLGKLTDALFARYDRIIVADVVKEEILKWKKSERFAFIATVFLEKEKAGQIIVINHTDLKEELQRVLEKQLVDLNFRFDGGLGYYAGEKHKGEIVSALYANHFGIPFLKSNDGTFKGEGEGRKAFPDLVVKDRKETVKELKKDRTEQNRILQEIADNRKFMDEGKRIHNESEVTMDEVTKLLQSMRSNMIKGNKRR